MLQTGALRAVPLLLRFVLLLQVIMRRLLLLLTAARGWPIMAPLLHQAAVAVARCISKGR
jgi:hypothetical protein